MKSAHECPQTVICRDNRSYFVEYILDGREMNSRHFQTHEQAREEQKRISTLINVAKLNEEAHA